MLDCTKLGSEFGRSVGKWSFGAASAMVLSWLNDGHAAEGQLRLLRSLVRNPPPQLRVPVGAQRTRTRQGQRPVVEFSDFGVGLVAPRRDGEVTGSLVRFPVIGNTGAPLYFYILLYKRGVQDASMDA